MKVTLDSIKAKLKGETYLVLPDGRTTLCVLTMENKFTIIGTSACVDPNEFDMSLGRKYAFEDALRQVFTVEAYLLAEKNHWHSIRVEEMIKEQEKKPSVSAPWGLKKDGTPKKKPGRSTT